MIKKKHEIDGMYMFSCLLMNVFARYIGARYLSLAETGGSPLNTGKGKASAITGSGAIPQAS